MPEILIMRVLDGLACALLAAAACARARSLGGHFTGALVLGCLCGLFGPLLREAFLHGQTGSNYILAQLPPEALCGALAALAAMWIARGKTARMFFWLDSASIGLATSVGALMGLGETGVAGALTLGLINGLAPGVMRDCALGDTAMLVEKSWYATAAMIGAIVALAIMIAFAVVGIGAWSASHAEAVAALGGLLVVMAIRGVKAARDRQYML